VSAAEIARHVGCTRARAERLLDILSGNAADSANAATDFLVYEDDSGGRPLFCIAKDIETAGIPGGRLFLPNPLTKRGKNIV